MDNCIFCKIISKQLPSKFLYEDDDMIAINDIKPSAPVHILIIPKKHISTIDDIVETDEALLGKMIFVASHLARDVGIAEKGYKLIFNVGDHGGQIINHIHLHLLGGKKF